MSILSAGAAAAGAAAKPATTTSALKSASSVAQAAAPATKTVAAAGKAVGGSATTKATTTVANTPKGVAAIANTYTPHVSTPAVTKTISAAGKAAASAGSSSTAKPTTVSNAASATTGAASSSSKSTSATAATKAASAAAAYTKPAMASANSAIAVGVVAQSGGFDLGAVLGQIVRAAPAFLSLGGAAGAIWLASASPAGGESEREFEALVNANINSGGGATAPDKTSAEADVEAPAKTVPNPYGKKGGPAHQAKVKEVKAGLEKEYEGQAVSVQTEVKVDTPDGEKKARYLDVGVVNIEPRKLIEGVQVGKALDSGLAPARERRAISDLNRAEPNVPIGFTGYNK